MGNLSKNALQFFNYMGRIKGFKHPEALKQKISSKMQGHKISNETKLKISLALKGRPGKKGKFASSWKGGITPVNSLIRHSRRGETWRVEVFKRDNYTCVWCGIHSGMGKTVVLNADHIIPFSKIIEKLKFEQGVENLFKKAMNYELLWDINNGRTLCQSCHKKTDTFGGKSKFR